MHLIDGSLNVIILNLWGELMVLEAYLKNNDSSIKKLHIESGISESTIRGINNKKVSKWKIEYIDAIAKTVKKNPLKVVQEIKLLEDKEEKALGHFDLENRRYIGSKSKLLNWISNLIDQYTCGDSFFDVFAGTGVVTRKMIDKYDTFIINDFLFSNYIIYKAFFDNMPYDKNKLLDCQVEYQNINTKKINDNYFNENFGDKFFSKRDAKVIGEIRIRIKENKKINEREKDILLASLLYSSDKISNTVGHYDAYRKKVKLENKFLFELINPIDMTGKEIKIFKEDANKLVRKIKADVAFIDPPYNSRQYSRFYHVLENLAKWEKPKLYGVAMKPKPENMSDYCRSSAPQVFNDLISNLNVKYIVVTYNNTYDSKSNSSKNKISHREILKSLNMVGHTKIFEKPYQCFNTGKTNMKNHKEYVFITEVEK